MTKLAGFLIITMAGLLSAPGAMAQKATERYIPIGQSPGLSKKYTMMGEIEGRDDQAETVTIASPGGSKTVKIKKDADIWLDRTSLKLTNLRGKFSDLRKGRKVEVKYRDEKLKEAAEWIKVEISNRE